MPGIVGLITKKPREWAEAQLLRMVQSLRHESFYATGTLIDESLGVYVGWTVQENSFSDGMPLSNERGNVSLVFSGEEYPEPGTAQRLKQQGHAVELKGPSYLVHLSEEDPAFPAGLNGMFHGVLIDRTAKTATLFNDRYGMHRIHYHEAKEAFYFAAEAKAILAVRPELRKADPRGLGEFVACGCVLEDRTLFEGIRLLPAGSAWVFHNGTVRKDVYFHPSEWERQAPLDSQRYFEELRDVLSQNLPRYFNGGQRIGIALTGGLDTRLIMARQNPAAGTVSCYTFGSMFRECQDVRLARQIAKLSRQSYEVFTVGDEFLARFPHYAERSMYLAEGGVDVYHASDLYVSERARQIAPVKIVGTYGSEIVRQCVMFKAVTPAAGLYHPEFMPHIEHAKRTYHEVRQEHPVTFAAFRQSPWYHHGILALEQSQLSVRSPFLDRDFVSTVFRAPQSAASDDVRLRLIGDGSPALGQIPSDRGIGGKAGLSSALAHSFQEFTFKAEYAYDYGMPQWISRLDHAVSPLHLERLFLGRHKFMHFRVWYRDSLAEYVRQMLLDSRTLSRPYLDKRSVEAIVHGHLKGGRNYTSEIHKLLSLELLHRLFVDEPARSAAHASQV